tara:strand:+ start:513 stop:710 length:198 start_codon:yes stop_codon:yes gene_type:complete
MSGFKATRRRDGLCERVGCEHVAKASRPWTVSIDGARGRTIARFCAACQTELRTAKVLPVWEVSQ